MMYDYVIFLHTYVSDVDHVFIHICPLEKLYCSAIKTVILLCDTMCLFFGARMCT